MYNKVFLIGNLTRDPELRYTTSGVPVTRFTLAINRNFKSGNQDADFIKVVTWRKLAEFCGEYLAKGKSVALEGRLQIDEYEKDGKKRTGAEIVADNVQFLTRKNDPSGDVAQPEKVSSEENIPF
jgi:single-strand DNA-binding protein